MREIKVIYDRALTFLLFFLFLFCQAQAQRGFDGTVTATAVQSDGKIIVAGNFTKYNGFAAKSIVRLNADGTLDQTFASPSGGISGGGVSSISFQGDKILLAGSFNTFNGNNRLRIARLNSNGTLDQTFNSSHQADNSINTISTLPDNKILISGVFSSYNGTPRSRIARLHADGSLDASFIPHSGVDGIILKHIVLSDGKILIGGNFTSKIDRLNADGSDDITFTTSLGTQNVSTIGYDETSQEIFYWQQNFINKLSNNGVPSPNNPIAQVNNSVSDITLLSNGKILLTGYFDFAAGSNCGYIAQLNSNGQLDGSFQMGTGFNQTFDTKPIVLSNGKILIGGGFTQYNGTSVNRIVRLNSDGTIDDTFNPIIQLTISGISIANKEYNRLHAATITGTPVLNGVLSEDNGNVTLNSSSAEATFDTKNVGDNKPVVVSGYSLSGSAASKYVLVQPTGLKANITPKTLSITGVSVSDKTYDGSTSSTITGTASLSGVITNDVVTLNTSNVSAAFLNKNAGSNKSVVFSGYSISNTDAGNYLLTQPTVAATINPKALSVTGVSVNSKVYDGGTVGMISGTASLSGVVGTDIVSLGTATVTFNSKDVGSGKSVNIDFSLNGEDAGNYTVTPITTTANITKATLTAKAEDKARAYGAPNPATTISYTGFKNNETDAVLDTKPTATISNTATATTGAGTTHTISVSGGSDDNYTLAYESGTLSIIKASLTAKADNKTRAYGAANPSATITYTGFVNNENDGVLDTKPTATISSTATATTGAGTTHTISVSGGSDDNYDIKYEGGILTISKASQSITFATIAGKLNSAAPFTVSATASSGLPVVFSVESGPATISGNTITLTGGLGTVVVIASQSGDNNYQAAAPNPQSFVVSEDPVLGIDNQVGELLEVYPVPAVDYIEVNTGEELAGKVSLIDMAGRIIAEWMPQGVSIRMDVNKMSEGVYVLQIPTHSGVKRQRVVIKR